VFFIDLEVLICYIEEWYKYDDDKVSEVKLEDVLNLRGGGDWHMAYYLIYRKIEIV